MSPGYTHVQQSLSAPKCLTIIRKVVRNLDGARKKLDTLGRTRFGNSALFSAIASIKYAALSSNRSLNEPLIDLLFSRSLRPVFLPKTEVAAFLSLKTSNSDDAAGAEKNRKDPIKPTVSLKKRGFRGHDRLCRYPRYLNGASQSLMLDLLDGERSRIGTGAIGCDVEGRVGEESYGLGGGGDECGEMEERGGTRLIYRGDGH
jgi:hypothetical protein